MKCIGYQENDQNKLTFLQDNSSWHEEDRLDENGVTMWYIRTLFKDDSSDYKSGHWKMEMPLTKIKSRWETTMLMRMCPR